MYDVGIYSGFEDCPGRLDDKPITYSTATGEEPVSAHPGFSQWVACTQAGASQVPSDRDQKEN